MWPYIRCLCKYSEYSFTSKSIYDGSCDLDFSDLRNYNYTSTLKMIFYIYFYFNLSCVLANSRVFKTLFICSIVLLFRIVCFYLVGFKYIIPNMPFLNNNILFPNVKYCLIIISYVHALNHLLRLSLTHSYRYSRGNTNHYWPSYFFKINIPYFLFARWSSWATKQ